jgi:hypothetical protein
VLLFVLYNLTLFVNAQVLVNVLLVKIASIVSIVLKTVVAAVYVSNIALIKELNRSREHIDLLSNHLLRCLEIYNSSSFIIRFFKVKVTTSVMFF